MSDSSRPVLDYADAVEATIPNEKATHAATSRERIIDSTIALIYERGLVKTTIAEVARRSKTSVGQVTHFFPSKNDLLAATLQTAMARSQTEVVRILQSLTAQFFEDIETQKSDPIRPLINACWAGFQMPEVYVSTEISIHCRTDAAMWEKVGPIFDRQAAAQKMVLDMPSPQVLNDICPDLNQRTQVLMAALIGLSVMEMTDRNRILTEPMLALVNRHLFPKEIVRRVESGE